jgi:hypothetical protein
MKMEEGGVKKRNLDPKMETGNLTVKRLRVQDDANDDNNEPDKLDEKGLPGPAPVNDQKKQGDNGKKQAGQPPPNTHPEGGDQEHQTADGKDNNPQEYEQVTHINSLDFCRLKI